MDRGLFFFPSFKQRILNLQLKIFLSLSPPSLVWDTTFSYLAKSLCFKQKHLKRGSQVTFNLWSSIRIRNGSRKETDKCWDFCALFSSKQKKYICSEDLFFFSHSFPQIATIGPEEKQTDTHHNAQPTNFSLHLSNTFISPYLYYHFLV